MALKISMLKKSTHFLTLLFRLQTVYMLCNVFRYTWAKAHKHQLKIVSKKWILISFRALFFPNRLSTIGGMSVLLSPLMGSFGGHFHKILNAPIPRT